MEELYKYDIYNPYAGLRGLKGLSSLSEEEQEEIKYNIQKEFPNENIPEKDFDQMFRNRVFKSVYGEDLFKSMTKEERNKYHLNNVTTSEFNSTYADSEGNLPSELAGIYDPEAKLHILTNTGIFGSYKTPSDIDEYVNKQKEANAIALRTPGGGYTRPYDALSEQKDRTRLLENNASILEEALEIQHKNKIDSVAPMTEQLTKNINIAAFRDTEYAKTIEKSFNDLMAASYIDLEGQKVNVFNYYNAFKDEEQLEGLSFEDKVDVVSLWNSLNSTISEDASEEEKQQATQENIDIINRHFQNLVNENTSFGDFSVDILRGVGTKLSSSVMRLIPDIRASYYSFTNNPKAINFLRGLDENGEELPWWQNVQYWNKVDQYGVFSKTKQDIIDSNGGISHVKNVRKAGEEYDIWNRGTIADALEMTGYGVGSYALDAATVGILKGVKYIGKVAKVDKALLRGAVNAAGAVENIERTAKIADKLKAVGGFTEDVFRMTIHSIPETGLEASNVFKEVYDYGMQQLYSNEKEHNQNIDREARRRYDELYGTEEQKDAEGNAVIRTPGAQYLTPEYLSIREQVAKEYIDNQIFNIEDAALKAYNTEFVTKSLANSLMDGTFKKYLFSKDITFGKQKSLLNEDFIGQNTDGTAIRKKGKELIKPISKRYGKLVLGGGIEELTDEMWNKGAAAVGYNEIDNYTNAMRDPESDAYINDWASNFFAWNNAAFNTLSDPATILQGVVGAISPLVGGGINPIGGGIALFSKEKNAKEKALAFVYHPLLAETLSIKTELHNIDLVLDGKDGKGGLNEIIRRQKSNLENAASSLHVLNAADKDEEVSSNWVKRFNTALKFVSDISNLGNLGEASSLYNEYIKTLRRLAEGNITQEDGASYDQNYRQVATNERGEAQYTKEQQAINTIIQENAQNLIDLFSAYNTIGNAIQNSISEQGTKLNNEAFNELLYQSLLSDYATKLQARTEASITGKKKVSKNTAEAFLKPKALEAEINNINAEIQALEKKIDTYKSKTSDSNTSISKYVRKKTIQESKRRLEELQDYKVKLEKYLKVENTNVLTKQDVLNLSPEERAKVAESPQSYRTEKDVKFSKQDKDLFKYSSSLSQAITKSNTFLDIVTDDRYAELLNYNSLASTKIEGLELTLRTHAIAQTANKFKRRLLKNPKGTLYNNNELITKDVVDVLLNDPQIKNNSKSKEALEAYKEKLLYEQKVVGAIKASSESIPLNIMEIIAGSLLQASLGTITKEASQEFIEDWLMDNMTDPNVSTDIKTAANIIYNNLKDIEKGAVEVTSEETLQDMVDTFIPEEEISLQDNESTSSEVPPKAEEKKQETASSKETPVKTVEGVVNSPSLEEIKETITEDKKVVDLTDEGLIPESEATQEVPTESGDIIGNSSSKYNPNDLKSTEADPVKRLSQRTARKQGDSFDSFMTWASKMGFQYQEIVDNVLSKINNKYHPKVYFIRPFNSGHSVADNTLAMVIEYTEEMRNDSSISIPGNTLKALDTISGVEKEYVVIGQANYSGDPTNWNNIKNNAKYSVHSDVTNADTYYVNSDNFTRIESITSGLVANAKGTDAKVSRSIKDLLEDPNANPNGLTFNDLVFGLQTPKGVVLIGDTGRISNNLFYHPGIYADEKLLNGAGVGNVFVYIPSSNGNYIPIYIPFKTLRDIKTGSKFYDTVDRLVDTLMHGDLITKRNAADALSKIFYTSEKGSNYIGVSNEGNFYIRSGAYHVEGKSNPSKAEVLNVLKRFYINYNSSAFDKDNFDTLNEAGAFDVDVISLSTFNAQFKVYNTTSEAESYDKKPINTDRSNQEQSIKTRENVYVESNGIKYSKIGNTWVYTDTGKKLENKNLANRLDLYIKARARGVTTYIGEQRFFITEDNIGVLEDTREGIVTVEMSTTEDILDTQRDTEATKALTIEENIEKAEEVHPIQQENVPIQQSLDEAFSDPSTQEKEEKIEEESKNIENNLENPEIISNFASTLDLEKNEGIFFDIADILFEKGIITDSNQITPTKMAKILVSMGVTIDNLDSIDTIKDIIKICR